MKPQIFASTRHKYATSARGPLRHTLRQPSPYGPHSAPELPPDRRESKQALRHYLSH